MADLPRMFPPWLDRIQIKYFNPVVRRVAGRVPGVAKLTHRGRRSGRNYQTPVTAYRKGGELAIVLGHGETDWVRNVLAAGEADIELFRDRVHLRNPRVVPPGSTVAALPGYARMQARKLAVFVADVS